jgi:hypothetical protein
MIFPVVLKNGSRIFHMYCELTETGQTFEKFTIWPKDNPYKRIVIQNNRPLIRKKLKLKTKRYSWKVVSGEVKDQQALDDTIAIIEQYLEENFKDKNLIS